MELLMWIFVLIVCIWLITNSGTRRTFERDDLTTEHPKGYNPPPVGEPVEPEYTTEPPPERERSSNG